MLTRSNSVNDKAYIFISESVRKSILLNTNITNRKNNKSIDIGGLNQKEEQDSPFKKFEIENINSDDVHLTNKYGKLLLKSNSPQINGKFAKLEDFSNEIEVGFNSLYNWIMNNNSK